jgi:hypothetical protein
MTDGDVLVRMMCPSVQFVRGEVPQQQDARPPRNRRREG